MRWSSTLLPVIYLMETHSDRFVKTNSSFKYQNGSSSSLSSSLSSTPSPHLTSSLCSSLTSFLSFSLMKGFVYYRSMWKYARCNSSTGLTLLWVSHSTHRSHFLSCRTHTGPAPTLHHTHTALWDMLRDSPHYCCHLNTTCRSAATHICRGKVKEGRKEGVKVNENEQKTESESVTVKIKHAKFST